MPQATEDPEAVFENPGELAQHLGLTRGQKIAALERWAFVVGSRIDAVSEGMANHPEGAYTRDVALRREIAQHLDELRQSTKNSVA